MRRYNSTGASLNARTRVNLWKVSGKECFGLICLLGLFLVLFFRYGTPLSSDGYYYFAYLPSLVLDKDLNFVNQYSESTDPYGFRDAGAVPPPNPFPIGAALLWFPFFLVGRGLVMLGGAAGPLGGYGPMETHAVAVGSVIYGALALFLTYRLARDAVSERTGGLAAVGVGMGSFLLYYTVFEPSFSHAPSAFIVSVFIYFSWVWRRRSGWERAVVLGLILGLAAAVRPQNVLFGLIPFVWLGLHLPGQGEGRTFILKMRNLCLFVVCIAIGFLPQLLTWWVLYGKPLTVPQGEGFMRWTSPAVSHVLFSTRHGLFAQTPIAFFSVLGLLVLFRRKWRLAMVMMVALTAQGYLNAAVTDWWAGAAFGMRRFAAATPILGIGLAAFLDGCLDLMERRARLLRRGLVYGLVLFLVWLNAEWVALYRRGRIPGSGTWSPGEAFVETAANRFRWVYGKVGNPFSCPANWLFAIRFRTSPARYDRIVGDYFLYDMPFPGAELNFGRKEYEPFLVSGFLPVEGDSSSPSVSMTRGDGSRVLIPLYEQASCDLHFRVAPLFAAPKQGVELFVEWNGDKLAVFPLEPGWNDRSVFLSGKETRVGLNELTFFSPSRIEFPFAVKITQLLEHNSSIAVRSKVEFQIPESLERQSVEVDSNGIHLLVAGDGVLPTTAEAFDTWGGPWEEWRLKRFVDALPDGEIVIGLVNGKVGKNFAYTGWQALRSLGCSVDLRGHPNRPYAFVGCKGVPPGTALEVFPARGGAELTIRPGDPLPVAIDSLQFERR